MSIQRVPLGGRTTLRRHTDCETAAYNLKGTVRVYSGEDMAEVQFATSGDFMYIPANTWYRIENVGGTDWVEAIISRNAAEEIVQEHPQQPVLPADDHAVISPC